MLFPQYNIITGVIVVAKEEGSNVDMLAVKCVLKECLIFVCLLLLS